MTIDQMKGKPIILLGFGTEGQATFEYLRRELPEEPLTIADQRPLAGFPEDLVRRLKSDTSLTLRFGPGYLDSVAAGQNSIIIKSPGIPASRPQIVLARRSGCTLTSHSQIFLSSCPRQQVIGITGTKGKSTTASLLHHILKTAGLPAELVGNIGQPPLARLHQAEPGTFFVHEFSSHQLAEIESSPHIAVLLNIVPEHLDYYASFDEYCAAKENITKFQEAGDFLVFNADYPIPARIAQRSKAAGVAFSTRSVVRPGCFLESEAVFWSGSTGTTKVLDVGDIRLAGRFNIQNVMAAIAAASLCGVQPEAVREAIRGFQGLPHRLELLGTFNGVTFYDDSIATVPDATLAALEALGEKVHTLILGGHERNLDFTELGMKLPPHVKTVILFPPTGSRIWEAIQRNSANEFIPEAFFVDSMEQAVAIAYDRTEDGNICLLSPAAPSFGMFKDYRERGDSFKAFVKMLSNSAGIR